MTIATDLFNDIEPDLASELADYASKEEGGCGISAMLDSTGISKLEKDTAFDQISIALRNLSNELKKGDRLQIAVIREAAKRKLTEIGIQSPAALIDAALAVNAASRQNDVSFVELLPWPDPISGNDLLEDIASMFCRYVILSSQDATALVLWTILTYLTDAVYILPLLVITSPEKRCGKTLVLELLQGLTLRPLPASNISSASIYRVVEKYHPTLLIDEGDTFMGDNEELRGIINSGHSRSGAFVIRCDGDDKEPRSFSTWCPKAIALIGSIADTIEDRSVVIRMRRKTPDETIQRLRLDHIGVEFEVMRRKIARWAKDNALLLQDSDVDVPAKLNDRAADNWRPLVGIAEIAGGKWAQLARDAAIQLSNSGEERSNRTLLVTDMQMIFKDNHIDRISSDNLCKQLAKMEERSWPEWSKGKPITPRQVARLLKPFGITPRLIRIGDEVFRGYELEDLGDTLSRYSSPEPLQPLQPNNDADQSGT